MLLPAVFGGRRSQLTYFWDFSSVRRLPGWGSPFASCMGSGMWGNLGKGSRRWIRCSPCQLGSRPHSWARSFDPSSWYSWGLWSVHQSRWLNSMELPSFRWRSRKAVAPNRRSEANKCIFTAALPKTIKISFKQCHGSFTLLSLSNRQGVPVSNPYFFSSVHSSFMRSLALTLQYWPWPGFSSSKLHSTRFLSSLSSIFL